MNSAMTGFAVCYVERFGFSVLPVCPATKKPLVPWQHFQTRRPTLKEILSWPENAGLGIVTGSISGIVVVDCDSIEDAKWFAQNRHKPVVWVRTPRGVHFYFKHTGEPVKNGVRVHDRYDIRGDGGYVLCPPTQKERINGSYRWGDKSKDLSEMPMFRHEWCPAPVSAKAAVSEEPSKWIMDGEAYIDKIFAVSGQGGQNSTWRAAQRLKDCGYTAIEALTVMERWNQTNCQPPWSESELRRKIDHVFNGYVPGGRSSK